MAKITKFDNSNLRELRGEIKKALADVEAKFGISFSLGTIRYGNDNFRCKMTCKTTTKPVTTKPIVDMSGSLSAATKGSLSTAVHLVGSKFKRKKTVYTITGYGNPGSKYFWNVINERGVSYRVPNSFIEEGVFLKTPATDLSTKVKNELGI